MIKIMLKSGVSINIDVDEIASISITKNYIPKIYKVSDNLPIPEKNYMDEFINQLVDKLVQESKINEEA